MKKQKRNSKKGKEVEIAKMFAELNQLSVVEAVHKALERLAPVSFTLPRS